MHNFSKKKQPYYGSLYVVATPIGNINDISKRAIDILSGVDLIASEDTRHSKKLLNSIGIKAKQISYHKHNEAKISDKLIQLLIDGKNIALISDAGTPTLSDPGDNLIRKSIQKGITVSPIPGPSAITTALSVSGHGSENFLFIGFLPRKLSNKEEIFREHKKNNNYTLVFFESPNRVLKTLADIKNIYSDEKNLIITRELTKIYEEINDHSVEGHIKNLISNNSEKIKGEHVFIIPATVKKRENKNYFEIEQFIVTLLENDIPYSKAIKVASTIYKVNKSQIYKKYIKLAKKLDKD